MRACHVWFRRRPRDRTVLPCPESRPTRLFRSPLVFRRFRTDEVSKCHGTTARLKLGVRARPHNTTKAGLRHSVFVAFCFHPIVVRCRYVFVPSHFRSSLQICHHAEPSRCFSSSLLSRHPTNVPWCPRAAAPTCHGTKRPWNHETPVEERHGVSVVSCFGTSTPWSVDITAPRYLDTSAQWTPDTSTRPNNRTLRPRNVDTVILWRSSSSPPPVDPSSGKRGYPCARSGSCPKRVASGNRPSP